MEGEASVRQILAFTLAALALTAVVIAGASGFGLPASSSITYRYTREQLVAMYPGIYFFTGPAGAKKLALTFDDGPDDRATPRILDILKENSVKATFFLIGQHARLYPDIVRRIAAEGHTIGNHTWSHSNMQRLAPYQARREISDNQELLDHLTGHKTALVRFPWGSVSPQIMELVQKEGYRVIGWSVDSSDWLEPRSARIQAGLEAQVHNGAIILMHSIIFPASQGVTVRVLPALIKNLKARGYQFVTVDELLQIPAYQPAPSAEKAGLS